MMITRRWKVKNKGIDIEFVEIDNGEEPPFLAFKVYV